MNWYVYISLTFPVCLSLSVPHDSLSLYSTLTLCPFIVSVFLLLSPTPFISLFPSLCVVLFVSPLFFSLPNIYNTILPLCYPTPHCSPALLLPSSFSPLFISFSHVILTLPIPTSFHPTSSPYSSVSLIPHLCPKPTLHHPLSLLFTRTKFRSYL